jgi:hypothetical protein
MAHMAEADLVALVAAQVLTHRKSLTDQVWTVQDIISLMDPATHSIE